MSLGIQLLTLPNPWYFRDEFIILITVIAISLILVTILIVILLLLLAIVNLFVVPPVVILIICSHFILILSLLSIYILIDQTWWQLRINLTKCILSDGQSSIHIPLGIHHNIKCLHRVCYGLPLRLPMIISPLEAIVFLRIKLLKLLVHRTFFTTGLLLLLHLLLFVGYFD